MNNHTKNIDAEYVKSFIEPESFNLPPLPSIAFIGRSNVGKSSLINHLLNRKKLVKTSSTPGKTQMFNFFLINKSFYFIDLPGYGFAKIPLQERMAWKKRMHNFLFSYNDLQLVFHLLDSRHTPSKDDIEFKALVILAQRKSQIIANKIDKITKNELSRSLATITTKFSTSESPLPHSVKLSQTRSNIWTAINQSLANS